MAMPVSHRRKAMLWSLFYLHPRSLTMEKSERGKPEETELVMRLPKTKKRRSTIILVKRRS